MTVEVIEIVSTNLEVVELLQTSIPVTVEVISKGPKGDKGEKGDTGEVQHNLFVQPSAPSPITPIPYLWIQTGIGANNDITFWIEDGL